MKRIYDFGRAPARRNHTVADLQALKGSGTKLSMSNPANADEIRACVEAGIDLLVVWDEQLDEARQVTPEHFMGIGSTWKQFATGDEILAHAVEAECIAEEVLEAVNDKTSVVTFSLGSGKAGDVIMSFVADVCGEPSEEESPPKHAHAFGDVGRLHRQIHEERVAALRAFHDETTAGNFPYPAQNITMHAGEKEKFLELLDGEV